VKDEESGTAKTMKPKTLWESREEYQDFPLRVFRKHIYQERTKQLSAPFWQHKRNKNAMKKIGEAHELREQWQNVQMNRGMDGLLGDWEWLNLEE
jgi:hypothetical protein